MARAETHHTLRFFTKSSKPQAGQSLAFSPNSKELALVTEAGTTLVRVSDAEQIATAKVNGTSIGYSSDGKSLLLLSGSVSRFDCATRQVETSRLPAPAQGAVGLKLAQKNGKTIVDQVMPGSPAQRDGRIAAGNEIVAIGRDRNNKPKSVLGVSVEQALSGLAGAPGTAVEVFVAQEGESEGKPVRLTRALTRQREGKTEYFAAALEAPEPSLVCLVRDGRCELIRPSNSQIVTIVPTENLPNVRSAAMSPDGRHVALVGFLPNGRLAIECVDAMDNKTTAFYDFSDRTCKDFRFTADGKSMLMTSLTRILKLDVNKQASAVRYNQEGILTGDTFPGAYVVAGHQLTQAFNPNAFGGGLRWQIVQPNTLNPLPLSELISRVRTLQQVANSQDGLLAIGTAEGDLHLLDATTGTVIRRFGKKGDGEVQLLDFSPDGHWLAYYLSGTLHLVDVSGARAAAAESGELDRIEEADSSQFTLTSVEGAFTATFPGKPEFDANQHKYEAQQDNGRVKYTVAFMNFGTKLEERTKNPSALRDLYDTVSSSFAKLTKGRIEEKVDHDTEPVVERSVRWTFPQGGKDWRTSARLTARGTRMYILLVTQETPESVSQEQIDRFFSTFTPRDATRSKVPQ